MLPAKLGVNATMLSDRSNQPQVMLILMLMLVNARVVVGVGVEGGHGGRRGCCQMSRLLQSSFHVSTI